MYSTTISSPASFPIKDFFIASLLMVITGLAQRYLEDSLHVTAGIGAKGTILEIKEEKD